MNVEVAQSVWVKQGEQISRALNVAIEPLLGLDCCQDRGHAVVDAIGDLIGLGRDNGTGSQRGTFRRLPLFVETCKSHGAATGQMKEHRDRLLAMGTPFPLIVATCRNHTAAVGEGALEGRFDRNGLGAGIDHASSHRWLAGPGGDQPPLQMLQDSTLLLDDAGHGLGGSDIVTWFEIEEGLLDGKGRRHVFSDVM